MDTFKTTLIKRKIEYKFNITHNLSEYGLDITEIFKIWSLSAMGFEESAFCIYVWNQHHETICITTKDYIIFLEEQQETAEQINNYDYIIRQNMLCDIKFNNLNR